MNYGPLFKGNWKPIKRIAILPLDYLAGDPENEKIANWMTDSIIGELSKLKSIDVTGRTSVMRYRNSEKSISEIAQDLSVDAIVEGSVVHDSSEFGIQISLRRIDPEKEIWTDEFRSDKVGVFELQEKVARLIANAVNASISVIESARLSSAGSIDPEALDMFMKAYIRGASQSTEKLMRRVHFLEESVRIDPSFGIAYAYLASIYGNVHWWRGMPPHEAFPKSYTYAMKALEVDEKGYRTGSK